MTKELSTEQDVLARIGATDFRSISKKQLISFVSAIPDMDKETAMKCIEQFPNFKEMATDIISELNGFLDKASEHNKDVQKEAIASHRKIIDSLSIELQKEELSEQHRSRIIETMCSEAKQIDELAREHQSFLKHIANVAGTATIFIATIAGAILGVKAYKK